MQQSQNQETRLFESESPKFDRALCYAQLTREQAAEGHTLFLSSELTRVVVFYFQHRDCTFT